MRKFLISFILCLGTAAHAQSLPLAASPFVNDYADLLTSAQESDLSERLESVQQIHGVQMMVLTLDTQADFDTSLSMEAFASRVFKAWKLDDRKDGVLVMVLRKDRAMRVELGRGYGRRWDVTAQSIVNHSFLPPFRADAYDTGILDGTEAVIEGIVVPHQKGVVPDQPSFFERYKFFLIAGGVLLFSPFGHLLKALARKLRRCPNCGQRSLSDTKEDTTPPTNLTDGMGIRHTECSNCDYSNRSNYLIPSLSQSRSRSGFGGGGRSGGGGASGRW